MSAHLQAPHAWSSQGNQPILIADADRDVLSWGLLSIYLLDFWSAVLLRTEFIGN